MNQFAKPATIRTVGWRTPPRKPHRDLNPWWGFLIATSAPNPSPPTPQVGTPRTHKQSMALATVRRTNRTVHHQGRGRTLHRKPATMSEWVIVSAYFGAGLVCLVVAVCAIVWAIQDWLRSRRH